MRLFRLTLLCLLFCAPPALRGQQQPPDTTTRQIVRTRDGSTLFGRVIAEDSASIRIETTGGVLTIARADVVSITTVRAGDMHDGQYWFPDPNRTRLFFAPTGRMLDAGEGYYMNTYLLFQSVAGGFSSRVTLGGGFSLLPGVNPSDWLYYFTPKVGVYQSSSVNVAVGAFAGFLPETSPSGFGILYGVATEGGPNGSITEGVGFGYAGSRLAQRPVGMLGGQQRVSRRIALISENYLYVEKASNTSCVLNVCTDVSDNRPHALVSYGLRFLGDKLSVDFAFFNVAGQGADWIFPGVPYLSFGVKF
jgi:hypothetical protein